jgi:hypothetical protein
MKAWWSARSKRAQAIIAIVGLLVVYAVVGPKTQSPTSTAIVTATPISVSTSTAAAPAATAAATVAPTLAPTPVPTPAPVVLRGTGQTATEAITLPGPISRAAFTHNGVRNFAVHVFVGTRQDLLINTIGSYEGTRPLRASEPIRLNIEADGAWTVTITAMTCCAASGDFAGHGDAVSAQFNPPGPVAWEFLNNNGTSNYAVWTRCVGSDALIQNRIGVFQGSSIVSFARGPCYWEVISDGDWTIKPR